MSLDLVIKMMMLMTVATTGRASGSTLSEQTALLTVGTTSLAFER